jgi:hypothetical protein
MLLMLLGILSYVLTDMASPTALIPAGFGLVISVLGFFGRDESRRKTFMHLAMGVALIGIMGSISGFASLPALISGEEVVRPAAVISRSLMAIILIVYLAAGLKSFAAARRGRSANL